ncbi:hypothetical protein HDU83_007545 [Entophlyctis luteolus]|nr:hypothetical protein HDU83_007545 [Entophlyctis luteolus]
MQRNGAERTGSTVLKPLPEIPVEKMDKLDDSTSSSAVTEIADNIGLPTVANCQIDAVAGSAETVCTLERTSMCVHDNDNQQHIKMALNLLTTHIPHLSGPIDPDTLDEIKNVKATIETLLAQVSVKSNPSNNSVSDLSSQITLTNSDPECRNSKCEESEEIADEAGPSIVDMKSKFQNVRAKFNGSALIARKWGKRSPPPPPQQEKENECRDDRN